jgi:hypothetical protein
VITGFTGADNSNGNGILFRSAGKLFVKDTIIRGNTFYGIWVSPASGTAKASIDHCRLEGDSHGLVSDLNAAATVRDSVAAANVQYGFVANSGGEVNIENCVAANNGIAGIFCGSNSIGRVSNTTVTDNLNGLFIAAGSLLSRGNNTVEGNTSSDGTFSGFYSAK